MMYIIYIFFITISEACDWENLFVSQFLIKNKLNKYKIYKRVSVKLVFIEKLSVSLFIRPQKKKYKAKNMSILLAS